LLGLSRTVDDPIPDEPVEKKGRFVLQRIAVPSSQPIAPQIPQLRRAVSHPLNLQRALAKHSCAAGRRAELLMVNRPTVTVSVVFFESVIPFLHPMRYGHSRFAVCSHRATPTANMSPSIGRNIC
jgi:hypothetical protein